MSIVYIIPSWEELIYYLLQSGRVMLFYSLQWVHARWNFDVFYVIFSIKLTASASF